MINIQTEMPMLKRSESFGILLYVTIIVFFIAVVVGVVCAIVVFRDQSVSNEQIEKIYFILGIVENLLISSLSVMIGYMIIKLNRPLVTRKNLKSGEEVSMLMFVK